MPLFQDMLEICFHRVFPERKDGPDPREFPTARELARYEKRRAIQRASEQRHKRKRAARTLARYHAKKDLIRAQRNFRRTACPEIAHRERERIRAWWADPENSGREADRRARIYATEQRRAAAKSARLGRDLAVATLAALEHPSYLVIDANGRQTRERWPIDDDAARWLAENDPGHPTAQVSTKPLDTNTAQA